MTSRPSRGRKPAPRKQPARKRPTGGGSTAGSLASGDVYEDYLRGVAKAQTLPPTIPGVSCPPFTVPAAQCQPAGGVESAAGFPTIPLQHCVRTIPGLNCPVDTLPIVKCLPDEPAGSTIPIVGCPKTIPGVTCDLPTVPVLGCVPEHAEADVAAPVTLIPTVIPPCPTIPGVSCPVPTVPIASCAQDRTRTLPVVGCPPTLPGITCPLPTVPVIRCIPDLATPITDATAHAARVAVDEAPETLQRYKKLLAGEAGEAGLTPLPGPATIAGPTCHSLVVSCPSIPPFACPITLPPGCRTVPPFCQYQAPQPADAAELAGFAPLPTIPVQQCIKTIPGVNCPLPTIPILDCLPIRTLPVVGCPETIPGVTCEIETIPLVRCIGDKVPDEPQIETILPPCPTVPGVTCPIRTIPIHTCLPGPEALADAEEADVKAAATLPVIGCPPTIPGVTCKLPTVPVVTCLDGPEPPWTRPPMCPGPYTVFPGCPPPRTLPGACPPPTLRCGYGAEAVAPTQPPGCRAGAGLVSGDIYEDYLRGSAGLVRTLSAPDCLPGAYVDPSTYTLVRCPTQADPWCGLLTLSDPQCFPPTMMRGCPSFPLPWCPPAQVVARGAQAVPPTQSHVCQALIPTISTPDCLPGAYVDPTRYTMLHCPTLGRCPTQADPWCGMLTLSEPQCFPPTMMRGCPSFPVLWCPDITSPDRPETYASVATPCPTPMTIPVEICDPVRQFAAAQVQPAQAVAVPQSLLRLCPSLQTPCPTPPVTLSPWQCRTRDVRQCYPSLASPCPTPPVTVPVEICDPARQVAAARLQPAEISLSPIWCPTFYPYQCAPRPQGPTLPVEYCDPAPQVAAAGLAAYQPSPQGQPATVFWCETVIPWLCYTRTPQDCFTLTKTLCPTLAEPCPTWICGGRQPQGF